MPISITNGTAYTQNFDALAQTGTANAWSNDSTLQGWYLFDKSSTALTAYAGGTGSGNAGSFYSFGSAAAIGDRALGGLGSGGAYYGSPGNNAVAGWIAVAATNNTGATINSITLSFNGEEWRNGGNATAQSMVLEYGFGSSFTAVTTWNQPGGSFNWTSPVASTTAAAVDGNNAGLVPALGGTLTTNWAAGSTMWIRWVEVNDAGNDHGLAIDNFSLTAGITATTPNVNLSVDKTTGSEAGTTVITVTATASGAVSGDQTMHLGVSGAGITIGDYTLSSDTITILSGQTKGSVTFTVVDDTIPEGTEAALLTISNPSSGITLGTTATQSVTIADDDAALVNLSISTNAGSEAGTTLITVTATASKSVIGDQTVKLNVGGTGITADDYSLSDSIITIADGATQGTVTFTVKDDAIAEGTETAVLSITNPSGGVQLGATTTQNIAITDNDKLTIAQIQGATHISSFNGKNVFDVAGIVTMVAGNGFYLQDPTPDANPATSEAIFVFTSTAPTQHVGDAVKVSGLVQEFRPSNSADNLTVTEITSPVVTAWTDAPITTIAPVVIGVDRTPPTSSINNDGSVNVETGGDFDPTTEGIDFWESLEGMLVSVQNPVAVSPTIYSATNTDGELYVLANNGAEATGVTDRGGVVISATDMNPERLQIDGLKAGIAMPDVDVGAKLSDLTGVINYFGNNYELLVPSTPTVLQPSTNAREVTTVTGSANQLTVATFNVENLDPSDGAVKFNALATAIVNNLKAPDILSVEEIQDNNGATNNGVVAANVTIQMLIDAIALAGGPHYEYRQIDPVNGTNGGEGGGNIRVAFLYNPERVTFVEGSLTLIDPTNAAFSGSRKPLVGTFEFNGEQVTVIGNHFASKGGDDPLYGPVQPPVLSSEVQRDQQATVVANYVHNLETSNPNAKIIVMGDLNDFQFSTPLTILENAGLNTLIETLPANEQYTYNYQGNAQAIDHIMASDTLMSSLTGFDVVHINSEFQVQVSDHDPLVARFLIEPAGLPINGTNGKDNLVGTAGKDTITGGRGTDTLTGGASADKFVYNSTLEGVDTITDFTLGSDSLVITALLASVGYTGNNPVGAGYLSTMALTNGSTAVMFDVDGTAGAGVPRQLVILTGVSVSNAAVLLDPSLYHPAA